MATSPTSTPLPVTKSSKLTPPILLDSSQDILLIHPKISPEPSVPPEPVWRAPEELRMLDSNSDGKLTRRETRENVNKLIDGLKAAPCELSRAALVVVEQAKPGSTAALTQGTPSSIRQAETALATRVATAANTILPTEAASHLFSNGVERVRPSDFTAAAHALGQRLRECGLTDKDIPKHSSPYIEMSQNTKGQER